MLYGYKPPYENKVPFNHLGVAPAVIVGAEREWGPFLAGVSLLGNAALILNFAWRP